MINKIVEDILNNSIDINNVSLLYYNKCKERIEQNLYYDIRQFIQYTLNNSNKIYIKDIKYFNKILETFLEQNIKNKNYSTIVNILNIISKLQNIEIKNGRSLIDYEIIAKYFEPNSEITRYIIEKHNDYKNNIEIFIQLYTNNKKYMADLLSIYGNREDFINFFYKKFYLSDIINNSHIINTIIDNDLNRFKNYIFQHLSEYDINTIYTKIDDKNVLQTLKNLNNLLEHNYDKKIVRYFSYSVFNSFYFKYDIITENIINNLIDNINKNLPVILDYIKEYIVLKGKSKLIKIDNLFNNSDLFLRDIKYIYDNNIKIDNIEKLIKLYNQMEKDYIHNEKSYFESLKNIKSNGILKNMNIEYNTNMYRKLYAYNFLKKYINENIDNSIKLTEIEL